jgi:ABC-2 type transport system ATP-binding protein
MYVKEFLHFIANIHKLDNKTNRIKDIIELTGLEKEQNKIIGSLSKGYRQRVGLSQAIMHDPKVLILDEPTSGLDMNQLMDIRGLIKKLGKEKTVIFSSHIMQEVQAICDRVVILNNGQKIVDESIEMLQGKMDGHQSVKVTFAEQKIDVKRFENMQMVKEVSTTKDGFIFISNGKADIRSDIFNAAVQQGLTIIEM